MVDWSASPSIAVKQAPSVRFVYEGSDMSSGAKKVLTSIGVTMLESALARLRIQLFLAGNPTKRGF